MIEKTLLDATWPTENEAVLFEEEAGAFHVEESFEATTDEVQVAAAAADGRTESVYRVVDLRGRFCPADSSWATRKKTLGNVTHYNGPEVGAQAHADIIAWIKFITELHKETGRFSPGWRFNGIAYHEFIWRDVVYLLRNPDAVLPHCGNTTWNFGSIASHVPIGGSQRADATTLRTHTARALDHLAAMGLPRTALKGHLEVGASACPGTLMEDFVKPFRAGKNPGGDQPAEPEKPEPEKPEPIVKPPPKIWLPNLERIAAGRYEEKHLDAARVMTLDGADRAVIVPRGVEMLVPKPAKPQKEDPAEPEPVEPEPIEPVKPEPPGDLERARVAAVVDAYFSSLHSTLAPYTPVGAIIYDEAKRANLHITSACALVEQESAGRNVFGADWGTRRADHIPFAHLPVTGQRVRQLVAHVRAGGVSNGVGLTQLTWRDFIYDAERRGGAHLPKHQCAVGFELLAGYYGKYPYLEAIGAYNAGESNRRSVLRTYSAQFAQKHQAWRNRLESAGARPPEPVLLPEPPAEEPDKPEIPEAPPREEVPPKDPALQAPPPEAPAPEDSTLEAPAPEKPVLEAPPSAVPEAPVEEPEAPKEEEPIKAPKLSKAAKAIVAAAVPLVSAFMLWVQTGTLSETEFSVAATGLLTALLVYFVPNSTDKSVKGES
ncbi:MAG: peptidoglycan recognition protein family protein [Rubrobacteraceae bacterium]